MVVTDDPRLGAAVAGRLEAAGVTTSVVPHGETGTDFAGARGALAHAAGALGPLDAVVVARSTPAPPTAPSDQGWQAVLAEHEGLPHLLLADAGWARAAADHAAASERPIRLVTVVDAATAGGRSRAQAAAQLARAARRAPPGSG